MNDKCKVVLQITVISLLFVLFVGSFTYTLAVYFAVRNKEVQNEFLLSEVCHPYVALSNITQNESFPQDSGTVLTNLSVEDIYRNYPKCLDVLLPVICQLFYPVIKFDSAITHSGTGVDGDRFINTLLLEECTSVIPNQSLLFLANIPTMYYDDITCSNGFYLLNYTCRPHCTQFEQVYHNNAQIRIGFTYCAAVLNIAFSVLFIVVACFKRKAVFKFPSILFVYIVILHAVVPIGYLINLLSGRTLLCSDDDLVKSLERPSPYCIISGILHGIAVNVPWLWFVFVAVMFWKLLYPIHSHRYHHLEKWIHIVALVVGVAYVIPYVTVSTADEEFYFIATEYPSFSCVPRNFNFVVLYLLFPAVFISSLGIFLLLIVLYHIQLKYGCSIWKNNDVINTAEKKIILLLWFIGISTTLSGVYSTLLLSGGKEGQAALTRHLLCELPGYIDNENDMTTCRKDDLETYSYTGLSIAYLLFYSPLLPLVFLLAIIEWRTIIQRMTALLHVKGNKSTVSNELSKLKKTNGMSADFAKINYSTDAK